MFTVSQSVSLLSKEIPAFPTLCCVLGTGWSHVLHDVQVEVELPYDKVFGVAAGVPGHEGKLVIGKLGTQRIALMAGRLHTYEGYTTEEVTRPLQVFAQLGLRQLVVTAAVGALNEQYRVGDFVVLSDVLTAFCPSPLTGPKFTDLSQAFSPTLRQRALSACAAHQIPVHEGTYCYVRGPHFESPADKMFYHHAGADVIGMSTVPETIMANFLKVDVLGLAFVTNLAFVRHAHEDVLAAAEAGSVRMVTLLGEVLAGG